MPPYRLNSKQAKPGALQQMHSVNQYLMKQCSTIAMLVFSAILPLSGQNAASVAAYLGPRYDMPAPAGQVEFIFSRTTLMRKADGKASYKTLLKTGYFKDDAEYGTFAGVRITEGGKLVTVDRYTSAGQEQATASVPFDPVRPRGDGSAIHLPKIDSLGMAQGLDSLKDRLRESGNSVAAVARPVWDFCMWIYYGVLPFLFGFGLVMFFISGLAADEVLTTFRGFVIAGNSLRFTHSWASFLLYCDLVIICVVGIINTIIIAYEATQSSWVFLPLFFLVKFLRRRASKIIPNISVAGTSGDTYTKETPLLGKGR